MINKIIIIFSIVLSLLLIFNYIINDSNNNKEHFDDNNNNNNNNNNKNKELFKVKRPWVNVYDDSGNIINVVLLSRPFWMDSHEEEYKKIKKVYNILGISSYQEFPNKPFNPSDGYNHTTNKYDYNRWTQMCKGWLHCFKNPEDYIPKNSKSILLSESDFCDSNINKPNNKIEKKYDFLYICHRDDLKDCSTKEWVAFNKNLELAEKCVSILCTKKKYKVLFIGRKGCKLPSPCTNLQIETTDKLDYYDLQKKYDECKFLFLPNIHDASPRVITEAMCHNLPCLINRKLVGGWKYITPISGEFFDDENNFEEKVDKIINNYDNYTPRKYFIENYNVLQSGNILKNFIFDIFGDKINMPKNSIKYITPEFNKINYKIEE